MNLFTLSDENRCRFSGTVNQTRCKSVRCCGVVHEVCEVSVWGRKWGCSGSGSLSALDLHGHSHDLFFLARACCGSRPDHPSPQPHLLNVQGTWFALRWIRTRTSIWTRWSFVRCWNLPSTLLLKTWNLCSWQYYCRIQERCEWSRWRKWKVVEFSPSSLRFCGWCGVMLAICCLF